MKTVETNLDVDILKKLGKISKDSVIYVDHTLGDDENDGLTVKTAFKTFERATKLINGKTINYTAIFARSGVYNESLMLYDFSGTLYIAPIDGNEGAIQLTNTNHNNERASVYSPLYVANTNGSVTLYKVELNARNMTEEHKNKLITLAYLVNAADVTFSSCILDGEGLTREDNLRHPVGIYANSGSSAHSYDTTFKKLGIPLYANTASIVTAGLSTFIDITDGYAAMHGGIVTGNRLISSNPLTTPLKKAVYSMHYSIDDIAQGIIDEMGTTSNGTYYKFNNGLLICEVSDVNYGKANIVSPITALGETAPRLWTFPFRFLKIPSVIGQVTSGPGYAWLALGSQATTNAASGLTVMTHGDKTYDNIVSITAIGRWK